jgi:hypothetical protein
MDRILGRVLFKGIKTGYCTFLQTGHDRQILHSKYRNVSLNIFSEVEHSFSG